MGITYTPDLGFPQVTEGFKPWVEEYNQAWVNLEAGLQGPGLTAVEIDAAKHVKVDVDGITLELSDGTAAAKVQLKLAPVTKGGTGLTGVAAGGLLYASAANTLAVLTKAAAANVLLSGDAPAWGKVSLAAMADMATGAILGRNTAGAGIPEVITDIPTAITIGGAYVYRVGGTDIAVADGGTGLSAYAIGDLLYASGSAALSRLAAVAVNQVLVSGGVGAPPAWSDAPLVTRFSAKPAVTTATLGNDLVTNGDFSTATGWAGTNWLISGATGYYSFNVSGITTAPTAGATYTDGTPTTFTVIGTNLTGTAPNIVGKVYVSGAAEPTPASGNLTKTGGTGDATVAYGSWTVAAYHNVAGANNLTKTLALVSGNIYQIRFDIYTSVAGTLTIKLNTAAAPDYGQGTGFLSNQEVVVSANGNDLIFAPNATWQGFIDNITVKLITTTNAGVVIQNSDGTTGLEIRSGGTGSDNTGIGYAALYSNTSGNYNSAIGAYALRFNTSGIRNTAIGYAALRSNTSGSDNSAIGYFALFSNTSGNYNSAIGAYALRFNTSGIRNTAIGYFALYSNTSGSDNSAIGAYALYSNTSGNYNSAIGTYALRFNTSGSYNTAIGHSAGIFITGGANPNQTSNTSLYLGMDTKAYANGDSNEIVIGYNTTGYGSNTVALGNTSIVETVLQGNVGIGGVYTFGTSAAKVLGLASGTAPTSAPADMAQMWVEDINGVAGYAGFHKRTETTNQKEVVPGVIIKTDTGSPANPYEGLIEINQYDNKIRMYADAGWRECAAW